MHPAQGPNDQTQNAGITLLKVTNLNIPVKCHSTLMSEANVNSGKKAGLDCQIMSAKKTGRNCWQVIFIK